MADIRYEEGNFELGENQFVLECLSNLGVPHEVSPQGLKHSLKHQNYFLLCIYYPSANAGVPQKMIVSTPMSAACRKVGAMAEYI